MSSKMSPKLKPKPSVPVREKEVLRRPALFKRLGAYLADWFFGDLSAALPIAFIYAVVTGKKDVVSSIWLLPAQYQILAGTLSILFLGVYFIWVPWKVWEGQTPGKRLLGIRIVGQNGNPAGILQLFIRNLLGIMVLESGILSAGRYVREWVSLVIGISGDLELWRNAGFILAGISALLVLILPSGRAIHDWIAGTRVITAEKQTEGRKDNG